MKRLLLLLCCLVLPWLAAAHEPSGPPTLTLRQAVVLDDPGLEGAAPPTLTLPPWLAAEHLPWTKVRLPDDWGRERPRFSGLRWYRFGFDRPVEQAVTAVYIERVCSNAAVYLNGELIGSGGRMTLPYTRNCLTPLWFALPSHLLREHGNELLVQVAGYAFTQTSAGQRAAGLSEVRVGDAAILREAYLGDLWWSVRILELIQAVMVMGSLTMLALWVWRPAQTYHGYFALWSACWAFNTLRVLAHDVSIPESWIEALIPAASPIFVGSFALFLMRWLGSNVQAVNIGVVVQIVAWPVLYWATGPDAINSVTRFTYGLLAMEMIAISGWALWRSYHQSRIDFWLLAGMIVALLVIATIEARSAMMLSRTRYHIADYSGLVSIVPMVARLIWTFGGTLRQSEQTRDRLEQQVARESEEIERGYQTLSNLRAQSESHRERLRIASDLEHELGGQLTRIAEQSVSPQVIQLAHQALEDMRLSVRGMVGEPMSLMQAFSDWLQEAQTRLSAAGIALVWQVSVPPVGLDLPARTQVQLTRVLREALSNVIRHSQATQCVVELQIDRQVLLLQVHDNGVGLPEGANPSSRGRGLSGLEHRVGALRGEYQLESAKGRGVTLRARIPLGAKGRVRSAVRAESPQAADNMAG